MICDKQIAFPVGSLVEYKHASILEIGIWPQSNWGEKFGNRTFQVVDAKQVFVGYPVLDLVTEYLVVEYPSNATARRLRFLEPQLHLVRSQSI